MWNSQIEILKASLSNSNRQIVYLWEAIMEIKSFVKGLIFTIHSDFEIEAEL